MSLFLCVHASERRLMFEVKLLNVATGKEFTREYGSPYLLRKFLIKVKYSKKVKLISIHSPYGDEIPSY